MATPIDLSGNTLYVTDIFSGSNTPNVLSGVSDLTTNTAYQRYVVKGINFNSATTDTSIPITLPSGTTTYKVEKVTVWGANHTLVTATAGLFTAAAGGGVAIVADGALTPTSGTADTALNMQDLTIASATTAFTDATLFFRIGTAEGAAATANVTLTLRMLG